MERVENALNVINDEHPKYLKDVERFIKEDPIFEYRNRIDIKRLKNYVDNKNKKLILSISRKIKFSAKHYLFKYNLRFN